MSSGSNDLKASAPPTGCGNARIEYLDGWRGLAILLVLQAHFENVKGFDTGKLGVDIFFVLSGLLMSQILFIKRTDLKTFYERRISRIFPLFFLFVVTIFPLSLALGLPTTVAEFASTLGFLRTYLPVAPEIWKTRIPIGHLWSLNVEEHSYILMSLMSLLACVRKREGFVLIGIGLLAILFHLYYAEHPAIAPRGYELRTECATSFVMLSAGYCLISDRIAHLVSPIVPVVTLILSMLCYTSMFPWWSRIVISPILLAFTANHLSEASGVLLQFLSLRPLRMFGHWSYSIYLWQQPFFMYRNHFFPGVAFGLAIVLSVLSFYLYENPARQWLNERQYLVFLGRCFKRPVAD